MPRPIKNPDTDTTTYSMQMKADLRRKLKAEADKNSRTLCREITHRLQASFKPAKRGAQQEAR